MDETVRVWPIATEGKKQSIVLSEQSLDIKYRKQLSSIVVNNGIVYFGGADKVISAYDIKVN